MILLKKVLRDLRNNGIQFFSIYIMTLIALFIQTGFESNLIGIVYSAAEYLTDTNYKDLSVEGRVFSNEDIESIKGIDGISAVNGIARATGKISLDKERLLVFGFLDGNDVSKMYLTDGTFYKFGMDGCWVEEKFAEPMGIRVGDILSMTMGNVTYKEEVKGIVYCPEYLYYVPNATYVEPEYGSHGFVLMDISKAPKGTGFDKLIIDLRDVTNNGSQLTDDEKRIMSEKRAEVERLLDDQTVNVYMKTDDENYSDYVGSMESSGAIATVFPMVFLAVALLGILTTMTRLTENQRVQIGTLKALGFSNRKVMLHYTSYAVITAFFGVISGIIVGPLTLGNFLNEMDAYYYQNPYARIQLTPNTAVIGFVAVFLCAAVSYLSTRKILKENAARILLPEAPKYDKRSKFESSKIWASFNFATRWNIRDVKRNKLRTAVSVAGILVCSMLIFMALGCYEALAGQPRWMYGEIIRADSRISFADGTPYGTVYEYNREYQGQMVQSTSVTLYTDQEKIIRYMTVLDDGNIFLPETEELEYATIPENGVMLSSRLVDYLGVDVGDRIYWKLQGSTKEYSAPIAGICRVASGQGIYLSRAVYEDLGGEFTPTHIYTNKHVPSSLKKREEVDSVNTTEELAEALENSNGSAYYSSYIIAVVAVVMGVVVLYNLGVLSYIEKVREIATLKVLGFRSGNIRFILLQQNLVITAMGAVLGIPFGVVALGQLTDMIMGIFSDMVVRPSAVTYLGTVVGTFLVSVLVNIFVSAKVKTIDMVEALKSRE